MLDKLTPEKILVNVLFDESKLTQLVWFTGSHVLGLAYNVSGALEMEEVTTQTFVREVVYHHGRP